MAHNNSNYRKIINIAVEIEYYFRIGMEASGNEKFIELIDNIPKIFTEYSTDQLLILNNILKNLLLAQENKNWILLADILNYVFIVFFDEHDN